MHVSSPSPPTRRTDPWRNHGCRVSFPPRRSLIEGRLRGTFPPARPVPFHTSVSRRDWTSVSDSGLHVLVRTQEPSPSFPAEAAGGEGGIDGRYVRRDTEDGRENTPEVNGVSGG